MELKAQILSSKISEVLRVISKARSSKWFIITAVSVAIFTDTFLYGVIVPFLPFALTERAGIAADRVQFWTSIMLASYSAALVVAAPISGYFADNSRSRQSPFLLGLLALSGGSVMLCVGRNIGILVAARVLQGFSSGLVWSVGLALLIDTVGSDEIGQAMGYVGIGINLGVLLSPLLGGLVFNRRGYYSVFAMVFALIALDIILRLAIVERKPAAQDNSLQEDAESKITSGNNREGQRVSIENSHEGDTRQNNSTGKRRVPAAFTLLSSKRFAVAVFVSLVQAALTSSFDTILPLFVRDTFGWDSTGAGLIFLSIVIPALVSPVAEWISDRYGTRLCLNIILAPAMAEIAYVIEAKEKKMPGIFGPSGAYAQSYGLSCLAFAVGGLVGSIWAGMIADRSGWSTVTWTLGLLSVVTVIPVVVWMGGRLQIGARREGDVETIEQTS
ncbi:uncharacterized protein EAE97_012165 [Botrytis byssoidea]|uniref:Major facilitator superfamily (MFS) profile domain-containing protein n=1 Tax=Botrytis byssoidea TaxID=139641 RepID=A0A9P5HLC2_9HELO|nr:uncharacterized protein EAE97_012165 [Botrytis byssoidea]KAF7915900.1 hypothetical protein EAE97_012165 [Botrytis byssoidea]